MQIAIHIPFRRMRNMHPKAPLNKFYSGLRNQLIELGHETEFSHTPFTIPPQDGRFHLTYHTNAVREDLLNIKIGYLPGYFQIDRAGHSGWSASRDETVLKVDPERASRHRQTVAHALRTRKLTRYGHLQPKAALEIDQGYLLVCLQCPDDTVMNLRRMETRSVLDQLLKVRDDRPILIKRHPLDTNTSSETHEILNGIIKPENGVCETNAEIVNAITNAHAMICCNSGAGFEALVMGKHVITYGYSDYDRVTSCLHQPSDLTTELLDSEPDTKAIDAFVHWHLKHLNLHYNDPELGSKVANLIAGHMDNPNLEKPQLWHNEQNRPPNSG